MRGAKSSHLRGEKGDTKERTEYDRCGHTDGTEQAHVPCLQP